MNGILTLLEAPKYLLKRLQTSTQQIYNGRPIISESHVCGLGRSPHGRHTVGSRCRAPWLENEKRDLRKHGERISMTRAPYNTLQNIQNTFVTNCTIKIGTAKSGTANMLQLL